MCGIGARWLAAEAGITYRLVWWSKWRCQQSIKRNPEGELKWNKMSSVEANHWGKSLQRKDGLGLLERTRVQFSDYTMQNNSSAQVFNGADWFHTRTGDLELKNYLMWSYDKIWPIWVSLGRNIPLQSRIPVNTLCASGVTGAATLSGMLSIFLEEIGEFREEWQKWLGRLRSLVACTQAHKNRCVCESERK